MWNFFWITLAYLPFLGWMSVPLTGDQKVYLSISMEMREQGNWLIPVLFGESSYYKPPFQYWMTLLGWDVFGFNLWGALIPSFLAVLGTAWFLEKILDQLSALDGAPVERPKNVALWFAAALGTATYGFTAQMEIYLVLFYAAAWWAALRYLQAAAGSRRAGWLYLAFAITGVSALVKSPLYSVLWGVGFATFLVLRRERSVFRSPHLYLSCVFGVVLGLLWFFAVLKVDGARFWADYAMRETWNKKSGNAGSAGALWGALLYFCFPFTLLLIPAFRNFWVQVLRKTRSSAWAAFTIAWLWVPAVFFTLYPYRIKPYLYLLLPALALLVDRYAGREPRESAWLRVPFRATGIVTFVLFALVSWILFRAGMIGGLVASVFTLSGVAALAVSIAMPRGAMRWLALCGLAGTFCFHWAATEIGERDIAGLREFLRQGGESESARLAMLDETQNIWHEIGLLSVAIKRPMVRLREPSQVVEFLKSGGDVILTDAQVRERLPELREVLARAGVSVESTPWKRWSVRAKFPFKTLVLGDGSGEPLAQKMTREFLILSR